jgi:uncharacterized membrane protein
VLDEERGSTRRSVRHRLDEAVPEDLTRLISLGDGIFAFSMTLLVLNLVVPATSSVHTEDQLWGQLGGLLHGPFEVYALGFVITAIWWRLHVAVFRNIRAVDTTIFWLDVMFLIFIGINPFAINLLTRFGSSPPALVFYAGVQMIVGLLGATIRFHCARRPELIRGPPPDRKQVLSLYVTPGVFGVSMLLAFVYFPLTYALWFIAAVFGRYIRLWSAPLEKRLEAGEIGETP